jgi:hypothetical protein
VKKGCEFNQKRCELKNFLKKIPLQIRSFWGKKEKKNFFCQNSSQLTKT